MTSFEFINDQTVPLGVRTERAWSMLRAADRDEEQKHAAKCFLTYRVLDDTVPLSAWPQLKAIDTRMMPIANKGLESRWMISQWMAELYLSIKTDKMFNVTILQARIKNKFMTDGWELWPASVLNFIRCQIIKGYILMMEENDKGCQMELDAAMNMWKTVVNSFNPYKHPYRFTEMREDYVDLQAIMFILRKAELVDFPDYPWMTYKKIYEKWPTHMRNAMIQLRTVNPKLHIW